MASVTPLNSVGCNSLVVTQFHQDTATPNVEQYLMSMTLKMHAKVVFKAHAIYSSISVPFTKGSCCQVKISVAYNTNNQ